MEQSHEMMIEKLVVGYTGIWKLEVHGSACQLEASQRAETCRHRTRNISWQSLWYQVLLVLEKTSQAYRHYSYSHRHYEEKGIIKAQGQS